MTIASQTSRISYTGDGSTTAFAVPFYFQANADLVVYLTDTLGNATLQVLGTNYNLTGQTVSTGGTCTFVTAPTTSYLVSIYRDPQITQTTSYNNNDPFPAKSHELALDKLTTIDQRTRDVATRSLHISDSESASTVTTLASVATRKNKLLGFDTSGAVIYPLGPTFVGNTDIGVANVDTRATAAVTTFAASIHAVVTSGQATAGDGLGNTYIRGIVGGPGAFQDGAGVWWNLGIIDHGEVLVFDTLALATAASIATGTPYVRTNGYTTANDGGGGVYKLLGSAPTARNWHFHSADGAWWQLVADPIYPKQVGAKLDNSTDDSTAMQAWLDYGSTFSAISAGQSGTAVIPTATLTLSGNQIVDGRNVLTLKRTTNIVAGLVECTSHDNVIVRNTTFTTSAGFSSTTSVVLGAGSKSFTVATGLNLVVGKFLQITVNTTTASRVNYGIASITSYNSGTGALVVNFTTVVGSGTFAVWLLDVYPDNGNFAASNIALRFTTSNNVQSINNSFSGRFYNALDSRNGSDVIFDRNLITGHVNRGIHAATYTSGTSSNNQVTNNRIDGTNFSQYGVNSSASDGSVGIRYLISGNQTINTIFQGIVLGGGFSFSTISNNNIQMSLNTIGVGIIVEQLVGTSTQQPQQITVSSNTVVSGLQGLFIDNTAYSSINGNVVSAAGVGYYFNGPTATSTAYNTVTGNIAQGCVSNGFQTVSGAAGGNTGFAITGNTSIGNGGTGILTDANSTNFCIAGNVSLANTTAQYTIGGTGHVNSSLNK